MARRFWQCEGTIERYIDPATGQPRRCTQKLMFYDDALVSLVQLSAMVEIKCPRCRTISGKASDQYKLTIVKVYMYICRYTLYNTKWLEYQ